MSLHAQTAVYDPDNIFAKILRGELPCEKVYEDSHCLAFMDIMPRADGHVLVIPKRHYADIVELADADPALAGAVMSAIAEVARVEGIAETGFRASFNTGAGGGQTVFHAHAHVMGGRRLSLSLG
jgi:histidine triad (HIT) family protein